MGWFCKKNKSEKSALQLLEEELLRQHDLTKSAFSRPNAEKMIDKITSTIIKAADIQLNKDLEKRLKSMEDAISDLYLTGRTDDRESN
jgi:hypothetical protein